MPKLLSGYIAKQIGKGLGKQVKPATLIKVTSGQRVPGQISGGTQPSEASYAARGFKETYTITLQDGSLTQVTKTKVTLLGATIAGGQVPVVGDKVALEGETYRLTAILGRDPDGASYEFAAEL